MNKEIKSQMKHMKILAKATIKATNLALWVGKQKISTEEKMEIFETIAGAFEGEQNE